MKLQMGGKMSEADVLFSWTSVGWVGHMYACPYSIEYMIPPDVLEEAGR